MSANACIYERGYCTERSGSNWQAQAGFWLFLSSLKRSVFCYLQQRVFPPLRPLKNSSLSFVLQMVEIPLCRWICIIYFLTRSLTYEFTENVKSNMLKTSRICHMWNVLSHTSSSTVSCCFTSESIKELWTKEENLLVNYVFKKNTKEVCMAWDINLNKYIHRQASD